MAEVTVADGGYGWVIVFGSFLSHFLLVGMPRSFGVLYVILLDKFEMGATATAWVHSLYNALRMLFGPVSSLLCHYFTVRKVVLVGSVMLFVGISTSAFATKLYHLYITYGCIGGLGGCLIFTPCIVIVGEYFNKKKGKAMGISTVGGGLGTVVFAPLFTFLIGYYGAAGGLLIIGGIMLHSAIAGMLFLQPNQIKRISGRDKGQSNTGKQCSTEMQNMVNGENKNGAETSTDNDCALTQSHDNEHKKDIKAVSPKPFVLLKNPTFMLYCVNVMTMPLCLQTVYLFTPVLAKENNVEEQQRALLISVMGATDVVARFVFGPIFDLKSIRWRRRVLHSIVGILFGLLTMCFALTQSFATMIVVCILHGFAEAGYHSQRATVLSEFVPQDQLPMSVGYMILFQGIGNLIGPIFGGLFSDFLGSNRIVFVFGGTALAIMSLIFLLQYFVSKAIHCGGKRSQSDTTEHAT